MRKRAKQLLKHPLIYGGTIVIFGNLITNFFYFLFNLFMSRNLSVAEYGTLASIMSLVGFPGLIAAAVSPMIVKFAGDYFAANNLSLARGLYIKMGKFLLLVAVGVLVFSFLFISEIGSFFRIENRIILLVTNFIIFFSIISVINMAFLQAKLAFSFQVFVTATNALLKLTVGMILVFLGFSITGATIAMLIAGIVSYAISFIPIKFIFIRDSISLPNIKAKELFSYGVPSALTAFSLTSFISSDIILVKHLFDPVQAGLYAGLSLVGRVIFYISGPIGSVMFPIIIQKYNKKENITNTLALSLFLVFISSLFLSIFYFMFPKFVILFFLKNDAYLEISHLVGFFGLYIALYAILSILAIFYLSIKKTNIYIPILIGSIAQIVLIFQYHQSFMQIIIISLTITFLLVCGLLIYYPYATKR